MLKSITAYLKHVSSTKSPGEILLYGLFIRLVALIYSIIHDSCVNHIKYTDIDYDVFTNASQAIVKGKSPYEDVEYRYSPMVALIFLPNILLDKSFGKLILIAADILGGHLHYNLNIQQGTNRVNSKLFLILWLFNPVTIAISTRGSFEPIITLLVLSSVYLLISNSYSLAGLLFGLSIHLKLYPIIYSLSFYIYMIKRKPYMRTQTKLFYWLKTLSPATDHFKFFLASALSLLLSCYISYRYYSHDYIEQSFLYHLKRKDLAHNFSFYFYLFRLLPQYQEQLSKAAFLIQFLGVLILSLKYSSFDTNRRIKLRKLSFSLFSSTFLFVSLNKVCTSQYFNWYLIFLPLILDNLKIELYQAYSIVIGWFLSQANWLFFAYLYEYQGYDVLHHVGNSSILFLISNLWVLSTLCTSFDASARWQLKEEPLEQLTGPKRNLKD